MLPEQRHQEDGKEDPGDHLEQLGDAHQQVVDHAAEVASNGADQCADHERDGGGAEADHQRGALAVQHPGENVAAQIVGAHRVLEAGRAQREGYAPQRRVGRKHWS